MSERSERSERLERLDVHVRIVDPSLPLPPPHSSSPRGLPARLRLTPNSISLLTPSLPSTPTCASPFAGFAVLASAPFATSLPVAHTLLSPPPSSALPYPAALLAPSLPALLSVDTGVGTGDAWRGPRSETQVESDSVSFVLLFDSLRDLDRATVWLDEWQRSTAGIVTRSQWEVEACGVGGGVGGGLCVQPYHQFYDGIVVPSSSSSFQQPPPTQPPSSSLPSSPTPFSSTPLLPPPPSTTSAPLVDGGGKKSARVQDLENRLERARMESRSVVDEMYVAIAAHTKELDVLIRGGGGRRELAADEGSVFG